MRNTRTPVPKLCAVKKLAGYQIAAPVPEDKNRWLSEIKTVDSPKAPLATQQAGQVLTFLRFAKAFQSEPQT